MTDSLDSSFILPCGATLKNRIAKSAMSENMASAGHIASEKFSCVYKRWAQGGAGLLITGNVMVDSTALGEPANIVIEEGMDLTDLKSWAKSATQNSAQCWVQLNHPGKQTPKFLTKVPVAPSAIGLGRHLASSFNIPRALENEEIEDIIKRFAFAAKATKDAGFSGVQIHGAHGYLVGQFLSPHHNRRDDKWGGTLENRMRFVVEIYQSMRDAVGVDFPIGIKLNSADFQKGGFSQEESMQVVEKLSQLGIDLIEVSGGTYESQAMMGASQKESTSASTSTMKREAYFLDYCEKVRKVVDTPLMLTGGFRSLAGINEALGSGACDIIGLGRSMVLNPNFPNELIEETEVSSFVHPLSTGWKKLDKIFPLEITWYTQQIHRMGKGLEPNPKMSVKASVLSTILSIGVAGLKRVRN